MSLAAAIPWEGEGVEVEPLGYDLMADMGNGARSTELLGVGKSAPDTGSLLAGFCGAVEAVTTAMGHKRKCTPTQAVVMSCEAHRRGALVKRPRHVHTRPGL